MTEKELFDEYQNSDYGIIESFGVAIRTCGLILGLTTLCITVAFAILKFILFMIDKI